MAKPEIREVISKGVILSTGEGLSGKGPFVSGSSLINGVADCNIQVDVDQLDIHSIEDKTPDVNIHSIYNTRLTLAENVHNVYLGSIKGNGNTHKVSLSSSEVKGPVNVTLTGPGGGEVKDNDYSGFSCLESNAETVLETNSFNKGIITLDTRFYETCPGLTQLKVVTDCVRPFFIARGQDRIEQASKDFLFVYKTIIGSANAPATYTIELNNVELDFMKQGRYPGVDPKHPLYDTPIIEAAHADSALCLKATGGAPLINMYGPLDLGKDNHGIVKLNDGSPVEHSILTLRTFSAPGVYPVVDKSVATLGTKDHQLKSLVVYPGALLAAEYHAYSYENLNYHAVAQVGEDSALHDVA